MIEKLKTAFWFAKRPNHWLQAKELALRKFRVNHDKPEDARLAKTWAAERSVSVMSALSVIGIDVENNELPIIDPELIREGEHIAKQSAVKMGGAGDIDLLYATVALSGAKRIIETGVAYGWSSLSILAALNGKSDAMLISVDMPYPKMGNEDFVGIVVPKKLRSAWQIIREPDRCGLEKALAKIGGPIDLCHYDSDKSWWGRQYAYPLLWEALAPNGIFISDDIQDNLGFSKFVEENNLTFAVTEFDGKFVGIAIKK